MKWVIQHTRSQTDAFIGAEVSLPYGEEFRKGEVLRKSITPSEEGIGSQTTPSKETNQSSNQYHSNLQNSMPQARKRIGGRSPGIQD